MTKNEIDSLRIGSIIEDLCGNRLKLVRIKDCFKIFKYIREDGSLSKGENWAVDCHLKWDKLIEL